MKVLGLNMHHIRKRELKDVLINKVNEYNQEAYTNMLEGHNYLLNDNFLLGYINVPNADNTVMVYMSRDDRKEEDGIYIRKKIKIIKAYIDKFLKNKTIISGVRIDRDKAHKFNEYLFGYKMGTMNINNEEYIFYTNKAR